jgi:hypothetical protein
MALAGSMLAMDLTVKMSCTPVIDGHEIDILRMEVAHELLMHGIELRKDHGFNPHITLAYVEQGSDSPITQVPTIEFEVASLSLAIGDKIAHYGLGSGEESGETVEPADDEDDEDDDDLPMPTGNTAEMDAEEQEEGDPPVSRALTFFDRMKDAYQSLHTGSSVIRVCSSETWQSAMFLCKPPPCWRNITKRWVKTGISSITCRSCTSAMTAACM